jgi:hypothetical protein
MIRDNAYEINMELARKVLLVGDIGHADFAQAAQWLSSHCDLRAVATVSDAHASLRVNGSPEVILFAQSRPGQFSQAEVEALHLQSPLSRLVVLLGSWCEGETRTGRPWSGVVRVFWHQWEARMIPELAQESTTRNGVWRLPRTATSGEQLACAVEGDWQQGWGKVMIYAGSFRDYQALDEACATGGYRCIWAASDEANCDDELVTVLYNGIGGDPDEAADVARLARRHEFVPIIVLLDFLRGDDLKRLAAASAAAVLAKPLLVSDLLWHMGRHIHKHRSGGDVSFAA